MMTLRGILRVVGVGAIVGVTLVSLHTRAQTAPSERTFTIVNVEASGAKIWLPSSIAARPGERVTLKLDNKLGAVHGFSIDEYGIHVVVPGAGTQEVTFIAKKGASRFYCQLHPAHIGGEVIVL
jgi:nitrosocyanin